MDDILSRDPTYEEVAQIRRDFPFMFDYGTQTEGVPGKSLNPLTSLINAFRCMKALTFDAPIPLLNTTNLYDWMKANRISIRVVSDEEGRSSASVSPTAVGYQEIRILHHVLSGKWNAAWMDDFGVGVSSTIALLVHESSHTILGKIHNCSDSGWRFIVDGPCFIDGRFYAVSEETKACPYTVYRSDGSVLLHMREASYEPPPYSRSFKFKSNSQPGYWSADGRRLSNDDLTAAWKTAPDDWPWDDSLEYGGAWAAQYWYYVWLSQHSGTRLTSSEKAIAGHAAGELRLDGHLTCGRDERPFTVAKRPPIERAPEPSQYRRPVFDLSTRLPRLGVTGVSDLSPSRLGGYASVGEASADPEPQPSTWGQRLFALLPVLVVAGLAVMTLGAVRPGTTGARA
jgi:hypothetical protein